MKTVATIQSNYIPWKGYFDIINDADLFLFYDEAQYTTFDWRNRNKIYTSNGLSWLTLPCGKKRTRRIDEVKMNPNIKWQEDHFNKLHTAYNNAPFYNRYKSFLEHIYFEKNWEYLSDLNQYIIRFISSEFLGIKTTFGNSCDFESYGQKDEKMLSLLQSTGCTHYVSGPSAKGYMNEEVYNKNGIEIIWKDYSGYPEYKQLHKPFEHGISIVDLLFNTGSDAPYYIWGWRENNE